MKRTWLIILAVVVIIVLWGISAYNGFIKSTEAINNQWAQVETQYQRRFDLVPNLVNTVRGATQQEQEVFGQIAEARTRYANSGSVDDKVQAAESYDAALARLLVIVENYPQLQSIQTFRDLSAELAGTENRISVERKRYNDMVQDYNLRVKRFPSSIAAGIFGFDDHEYYNAEAGAEIVPKVNF